jgi:hypothetical protein
MYTVYEQQHSFYLFYPGATILDNKMSVQSSYYYIHNRIIINHIIQQNYYAMFKKNHYQNVPSYFLSLI